VFEAVQIGHDARHRGTDDGLIQRGQQEREHEPADGRPQGTFG